MGGKRAKLVFKNHVKILITTLSESELQGLREELIELNTRLRDSAH